MPFLLPKTEKRFFFSEKHTVWLLIFSTSHAPNLHAKNFKHGFLVEIKRSELRMESVFLCSTCKVPFKEKFFWFFPTVSPMKVLPAEFLI